MFCGISEIEKGVQIGICINRWYDKLQIIVCKNGSVGINFEYIGVDGYMVFCFVSDIYIDIIFCFVWIINGKVLVFWLFISFDFLKCDFESFGDVSIIFYKFEWDMIFEFCIVVCFVEIRFVDFIEQNEFECLDFGVYGKNFIISMGFFFDVFVQMVF